MTYALSDIHGYLSIYEKIAAALGPEDRVIFLGDAGDRGPNGWECIKAIWKDNRFTYLKGNHEDMTAKAMLGDHHMEELSCYNGGMQTLNSWYAEGADENWGRTLLSLPYVTTYTNSQGQLIYLSHAGFSPGADPDEHQCIWDRGHIFEPVSTFGDGIVVHGHTPVCSIRAISRKDWGKPYWYANGQKCDIDLGTYRTGKACLLNLDTWEYEVVEAKDY